MRLVCRGAARMILASTWKIGPESVRRGFDCDAWTGWLRM